MRIASTISTMCMIFLVWGGGCSKEEQPVQPGEGTKVVKSIKRPPKKKTKISSTPEKAKAKPLPREPQQTKAAAAKPKTTKVAEAKPQKKDESKVKTAVLREKASKQVIKKEETKKGDVAGYYTVKKSDSLSSIAGRQDVYGNHLKWPILYRVNMNKLGDMKISEDFPERKLHEGVRLKIITPEELKKNQKKRADHVWVVNILSVTNQKEIVPHVVRLIRKGYHVYFTRVNVKGKDWMRLRLGFYRTKKEADAEGKKVMALLRLTDSWSAKIGKQEFAEFCGY